MSYHILHVLTHGAVIAKDRGQLVLRPPEGSEQSEHRLPFEDLRAVVIAARGVTLTSSAISALLSEDAIIRTVISVISQLVSLRRYRALPTSVLLLIKLRAPRF